ncbi:hypothetical protein GF373_13755 [bacterium]|nr:hypothetical protein [bacterium]
MKIKLDENRGHSVVKIFVNAGYDVETVCSEGLSGADDQCVIECSLAEARCLVTLDMDFSNPFIFNPSEYCGIAVLRIPVNPTLKDFWDYSNTLINGLKDNDIKGQLWIVQRNQIRIYQA